MFGSKLGTTNAPAKAPKRSEYGGIVCADTRDPMLQEGTYRVRVVDAAEGVNPGTRRESFKTRLQVVAAGEGSKNRAGDVGVMISFKTSPGLKDLKRFAVHAAGFGPSLETRLSDAAKAKSETTDGEAGYDALDESCGYLGAIIEATAGAANGAPSLVGRLADVVVSMGAPVINPQTGEPTGDHYRVYTWGSVPEEEQTAKG